MIWLVIRLLIKKNQCLGKKPAMELHSKDLPNNNNNNNNETDVEITTHKKRYISPEERQQIIDELRLV